MMAVAAVSVATWRFCLTAVSLLVLLPQHGLPSWTMLYLVWWDVQVDHCCVLSPPPILLSLDNPRQHNGQALVTARPTSGAMSTCGCATVAALCRALTGGDHICPGVAPPES